MNPSFVVGRFDNLGQVLAAAPVAHTVKSDLIIFPEAVLTYSLDMPTTGLA